MQNAGDSHLRQKLLVVDDEPDICEALTTVAARLSFDAVHATNFTAFRAAVADRAPHIILLDLCMPDVDGIGHLKYLGDTACESQILLMSGYDNRVLNVARRVAASRGLNVVGMIEKPIDVQRLTETLRRLGEIGSELSPATLAHALDDDLLTIHVQPKVQLWPDSGADAPQLTLMAGGRAWSVSGVEVLARLQHPVYGVIPPTKFIAMAETHGLIGRLTDTVLAQTVAQQEAWTALGFSVPAAVNISPVLLNTPSFLEQLLDRFSVGTHAGAPLTFEITETGAMAASAVSLETLTRIRLKGLGLSLDDFGTGFSSLVQLYRMPFSEMKIDRSLISELTQNPEARVIVKSTIGLAHGLGMTVCAEGVEDLETAEVLRDYECDMAQGFFFSRPLPLPAFEGDVLHVDRNGDPKRRPAGTSAEVVWLGAPRDDGRVWAGPGWRSLEHLTC